MNDADGLANPTNTSITASGYGSVSGIVTPGAGALIAVFVNGLPATGSQPATLNFATPGATSFTTLSPLLNQVFFVGDGLTGDGMGTQQSFVAPTGAVDLLFGVADACGYNGVFACTGDNYGTFSLSYTLHGEAMPEPSTIAALGGGLLGLIVTRRRRS